MDAQLERRLLGYVHEHPSSTWEQIADGLQLDLDTDVEGYAKTHGALCILVDRDKVYRYDEPGVPHRYSITVDGFERLFELVPSGEMPSVNEVAI